MFRKLLLFLLLPVLLLTGCAKKHYESADYYDGANYYEDDADYGYAMAEVASVERKRSSRSSGRSAPAAPSRDMRADADEAYYEPEEPMQSGGEEQGQPTTEPTAPERMVFYNGYAQVRVAKVSEGIDAVRATTEAAGGHVETIGADYVVVRVPVARFQEVYDQLLGLGEVLDKQVTADDVTDSFRAVSLRLETAKATRARLQELLAKAETEEEKLQLLREIQRLTDEIDAVEAQARTLKQLAAMSRITLRLVARDALAWQGADADTAELTWIRRMSPFHTEVGAESKKLALTVPEGMVALDLKRRFVAESADGARIWSHRLLNEPSGDASFWLSAVQERMGKDFASAEQTTIGSYQALKLVDRSDEPYTWVIALRTEGKHLHLVQIYYPTAEHEARHEAAVQAVLSGGEA